MLSCSCGTGNLVCDVLSVEKVDFVKRSFEFLSGRDAGLKLTLGESHFRNYVRNGYFLVPVDYFY